MYLTDAVCDNDDDYLAQNVANHTEDDVLYKNKEQKHAYLPV